jgi:predicted flap endonuclease-1-like 5' DNA nuclease
MSTSAVAVSLPMALAAPRVAQNKRTSGTRPPLKLAEQAEPVADPEQAPDSTREDEDDLGQIKGIGPKVQYVLGKKGLNRFADLADLTPEELETLLKAEIPSLSAKRIERENWIGQAQMRVQRQRERAVPQPRSNGQDEPPQEVGTDDPTKATREDWRQVADFFVSFGYGTDPQGQEALKTRVHHSQSGEQPADWDGVATDKLVDWMLRQANLPLPAKLPLYKKARLRSQRSSCAKSRHHRAFRRKSLGLGFVCGYRVPILKCRRGNRSPSRSIYTPSI